MFHYEWIVFQNVSYQFFESKNPVSIRKCTIKVLQLVLLPSTTMHHKWIHATLYSVQLPLTIHVQSIFVGFLLILNFISKQICINEIRKKKKLRRRNQTQSVSIPNRSVWTKTKILENLTQKPKHDNNNNNMFQFYKVPVLNYMNAYELHYRQ